MRRKQVQTQLGELDPLTNFGQQLNGATETSQQLNMFGEPEIQIKRRVDFRSEEPQVEWWDAFFLPESKQNFPTEALQDSDFFMDRITSYVQHPVPLKNDQVEATKQMTVPFYLTEKEKKKLRRKKRVEKEKEK